MQIYKVIGFGITDHLDTTGITPGHIEMRVQIQKVHLADSQDQLQDLPIFRLSQVLSLDRAQEIGQILLDHAQSLPSEQHEGTVGNSLLAGSILDTYGNTDEASPPPPISGLSRLVISQEDAQEVGEILCVRPNIMRRAHQGYRYPPSRQFAPSSPPLRCFGTILHNHQN